MPRKVDRFNVDGQDYEIEPVLDAVPTQGSERGVESGGVYTAMQQDKVSAPIAGDNRNFTSAGAYDLKASIDRRELLGINWYKRSQLSAGRAVAFGANHFVAVSLENNGGGNNLARMFAYSEDGVDWLTPTVEGWLYGNGPSDVRYGENGNFVAVVNSTAAIYYSDDDGISFHKATITDAFDSSELPSAAKYFNGAWIVGVYQGYVRRSTDNGHTWEKLSVSLNFSSSDYFETSEGCIISTSKYRSEDGINWTALSGISDYIQGITYANGVWIAVTGDHKLYKSTDDGVTWTVRASSTDGNFFRAAFFNGFWYSLCSGTSRAGMYVSSDNGENWLYTGVSLTSNQSHLLRVGSLLFAGVSSKSNTDGYFMRSEDGINWTPTSVSYTISKGPRSAAYGNGKIVAACNTTSYGGLIVSE